MTLTYLKRLALAATQTALSDHALFSPTRVAAHNRAVADLCDAMTGERVLQLLDVIEKAEEMRELGVEISRRCIEPPYMSEKAAVNEFIGVFDGPLQRKLDAALAKLERERDPRPQCPSAAP